MPDEENPPHRRDRRRRRARVTGCSSSSSAPTTAPSTATGSENAATEETADLSTAAYVDVTTPHDPLAQVADESGLRDVVLAFVLADAGACTPSWSGITAVDDPALAAQLADLRAAGGSVTVASGGASGDYLENACSDAESLAASYSRVLDATGSDHLEIDVEQAIPTDTVLDALARLHDGADPGAELTGARAPGAHRRARPPRRLSHPERGRPSKSVVTKSNCPTALSISGLLAASFQACPMSVRPTAALVPTVLLASEPRRAP